MTSKKLHPNVIKFKEFVLQHPKMTTEVRAGVVTWQELYEDWYLLGEDDPRWDAFKGSIEKKNQEKQTEEINSENKLDWMTQVFGYLKTMDINQIQQHINHVSQAIGAVQGVLTQFQASSQQPTTIRKETSQPSHPFSFRKD